VKTTNVNQPEHLIQNMQLSTKTLEQVDLITLVVLQRRAAAGQQEFDAALHRK